ncbi:MAG: alpha/beta hydrolase [Gammaproteobacteria bacterium]
MATTERTLSQAEQQGFQEQVLNAGNFKLTTLKRFSAHSETLNIYIEGDGHAWSSFTRISPDPTPHQPVALQLALLDPHPSVAYLARPCQYSLKHDPHCAPKYWTSHRFAPEVVASLSIAMDALKKESGAEHITLIGFSGGGGLSALLAARRNDVIKLITVAGDLDHQMMSEYHHTTPQPDSLNPIHDAKQLRAISQIHLSGEQDTIVPPSIAAHFISQAGNPQTARHLVLKEVTHNKGWEKIWPQIISDTQGTIKLFN